MEDKQAFEYFKLLEQQFWKKLDQKTIDSITMRGQLQPEDMLLYGEFGFTVLGLKPAMLIDFQSERVNQIYLETVVDPALVALKSKLLNHHVIRNIITPESDLEGCVLVYNSTVENQAIQDIINNKEKKELSEEIMATVLDYPGHLPNSEHEIQTMLTVIYFEDKSGDLTALTTFAIQENEKANTIEHFKKYYKECKEKLNMNMKVLIE